MKVDLAYQCFEDIKIQNTSIIGANLVRCNLSGSIFNNVEMSGINLNGSQLFNCKWKSIKINELNELEGHSKAVGSVCFSPDGNTLASGSDDKSVRLWDFITGQQKAKLNGHSDFVRSVCFSPDVGIILSVYGMLRPEKKKAKLDGPTNYIESVQYSPDGILLASGSKDESISLWDIKIGQSNLDDHMDTVRSFYISLDSSTIAVGSRDKSISLWDIKTGQLICPSDKHYEIALTQFKTPLSKNNPLQERVTTQITILLISKQTIFQAQGALVLKGQFQNQSGMDLKSLFKKKGSCFLEYQLYI